MPRALQDFSPIYSTEQVPLAFDFSAALASGETILTVVALSAALVSGIDATPASRIIGSTTIGISTAQVDGRTLLPGTYVLQMVGTLQPGAVYDFIATVTTSAGQTLTTNAHQTCPSIG